MADHWWSNPSSLLSLHYTILGCIQAQVMRGGAEPLTTFFENINKGGCAPLIPPLHPISKETAVKLNLHLVSKSIAQAETEMAALERNFLANPNSSGHSKFHKSHEMTF